MRQIALPSTYEIHQLPVWPEVEHIRVESRGTRRKFWISIEGRRKLWLLKFPRPNTGEHWAEKVAYEVGNLIGVNCARVELADYDGELVTVCESFDPTNWYEIHNYLRINRELTGKQWSAGDEIDWVDMDFHDFLFVAAGNSVLSGYIENYDLSPEARFHQHQHNVPNIINAVKDFADNAGPISQRKYRAILDGMASLALLDGLIGNVDRHHENWMIEYGTKDGENHVGVAPSFDHASSLGRELNDSRRTRILEADGILGYIKKGRGGVYLSESDNRAPAPLVFAQWLCQRWPKYTSRTLERIRDVDDAKFRTIVDRVPSQFMSDVAKDFAYQVLVTSKTELLENAR